MFDATSRYASLETATHTELESLMRGAALDWLDEARAGAVVGVCGDG